MTFDVPPINKLSVCESLIVGLHRDPLVTLRLNDSICVFSDERDSNKLGKKPYEVIGTDSWAKLGKEIVAGARKRPKWVLYYDE